MNIELKQAKEINSEIVQISLAVSEDVIVNGAVQKDFKAVVVENKGKVVNMLCKKCRKEMNNLTEMNIVFDIHNPSSMEIEVKNSYKKLSMADTITFRKALHLALDKSLGKISTEIFVQNIKGEK